MLSRYWYDQVTVLPVEKDVSERSGRTHQMHLRTAHNQKLSVRGLEMQELSVGRFGGSM